MPIRVSWGNPEKTYTIFRFEGGWTWEEYHQSIREGVALVKDIPYVVNILIDMSECRLFPQNLLSHFNQSMHEPPKPFDLAVIVTSSKFIELLAGMIERVSRQRGTRFLVVRDIDTARRILAEHDAEHPPSPVLQAASTDDSASSAL